MPSFSKSPPQIKIPSVKVLQEGDRMNTTQHPIAGVLSDVPEESTLRTPRSAVPNSPYFSPTHHQAAASTSTFRASSPPAANGTSTQPLPSASASVSQKPSEGVDRDGSNGSMKQALTPSKSSGSLAAPKEIKKSSTEHPTKPRVRALPRLPHSKDVELAPTTTMYWSKGPVYGHMPSRGMRAHSATLVDNVVWLFGGCDEKGCWKDVYCFDTETMQWTYPQMMGDIPLPCRAHTATLVDRKIIIFGGGQGPIYYDKTYILDTITRRWKLLKIEGIAPAPRRAHTAILYRGKIWIFGGGNGMQALNDVWTLDVGNGVDKMRWEKVETRGKKPSQRGYHTANLIGSVMIIVGGSDGRECFSDIWCLNLGTLSWSQVNYEGPEHRLLSHSATQVGSYLFIIGGHDGAAYSADLLYFNLVSLQWESRPSFGRSPSLRGYHATIVTDSRLFVFGGFNGHEVHDDVHVLDLAGTAYLPQVMSFQIDV